jgi:putative hemolysin
LNETIIDPDQPLSCILITTFFQPISSQAIIAMVVALALLILSVFLSASEIAFFSLTAGQIKGLRTSSDYRSRLLSNQLERPAHLMATMVVLRNVIHIAVVILLAYAAALMFNTGIHAVLSLLILIVGIALLIFIFSELIPSVFAAHNAMGVARAMAPPVFFLANIVYPLVILLVRSSTLIQRRLAQRRQTQEEAEITETIEMVKDR